MQSHYSFPVFDINKQPLWYKHLPLLIIGLFLGLSSVTAQKADMAVFKMNSELMARDSGDFTIYSMRGSSSVKLILAKGKASTLAGLATTGAPAGPATPAKASAVPSCTTPVFPIDGEKYLCPDRFTLQWAAVAGATGYKVYLSGDPNQNPLPLWGSTSNTSFGPFSSGLGVNGRWRIVPFNDAGDAVGCPIWLYTTGDNTPPSITCPANTTIVADPDCSGSFGAYSPVSLSDNCWIDTRRYPVIQTPASGTLTGIGSSETIKLTARDVAGNPASCTFTVTLVDQTPPTATTQNYTAILNSSGSAVVQPSDVFVQGSDNCGTATPIKLSPAVFSCADLGPNTVTLTVGDGNGNFQDFPATVIVKDISKPIPDVEALPTITTTCSAHITSFPTATDNCKGSITGTTNDPLSYSKQGTYTITWTYDDGNGNTETQTQTIIINDVTPPVPDIPSTLLSPLPVLKGDCLFEVTTFPTATDNCAGKIVATTTDPLIYTEQGTYLIKWTYDDGNGNQSSQYQQVVVQDNTAPTALCKNASISLNEQGQASVSVANIDNGSFDECGLKSLFISIILSDAGIVGPPQSTIQLSCDQLGDNIIQLTATDLNGQRSYCEAIVTVSGEQHCESGSPNPDPNPNPNPDPIPNPTPNPNPSPFPWLWSWGLQDNTNGASLDGYQLSLEVFPNPFQTNLNIRFELPQEGATTVEIFNLQGQRVRSLTAEIMPTDQHQIEWDATDDRGQVLPSGIYLIKMVAGGVIKVEKVLLQR